jgi:hypothetical protein
MTATFGVALIAALLVVGCTSRTGPPVERDPFANGVPAMPEYIAQLIPLPEMPPGAPGQVALARSTAVQLAEEAVLAALEPDTTHAAAHAYSASVEEGTLQRAVLAATHDSDLSTVESTSLNRARDDAIWIVQVQFGLLTDGSGQSMGGATYRESWSTVARLARDAATAVAGSVS